MAPARSRPRRRFVALPLAAPAGAACATAGPRPDAAVAWEGDLASAVAVRVRDDARDVGVEIAAHPLAEYGMPPPDIRAGSEAPGCVPCGALRAEVPMVRYSRGLALGNAARATRCVRGALEAGKNGAGEAPRK